MELLKLDNAEEYLKLSTDLLMQNEAINSLMLGLGEQLKSNSLECDNPYFALVRDDKSKIIGSYLRTPPQFLILSPGCRDRLKLLVYDLLESSPGLPGVMGPKEDVLAFCELWKEKTHRSFHLETDQGIYQLNNLIEPDGLKSGKLTLVTDAQKELAILWLLEFVVEAMPESKSDRTKVTATIERKIKLKELWFWEVDGEFVSMAGSTGKTPKGIRINCVYTPKEFRKKGHASACVAAVTKNMLDGGNEFCFLYTDLLNPTSNKIYKNLGYQHIGDSQRYKFD